jgi:predicted Zn-dependent protease
VHHTQFQLLRMLRRTLFAIPLVPAMAVGQPERLVQSSPVDGVSLYVIPTDGFPEQLAANIARALTTDTGQWVKSSLLIPSGVNEPLPGTNQYPADDYLPFGIRAAKQLSDANARTYFIVLTDRDINSRAQNFRFQYSFHSPMARTSVLSVARLLYEKDGSVAPVDVIGLRAQKMLMRIVGEMKLGWKRTTDPTDLMFSPIMSIEDIDRMSIVHSVQSRQAR